MDNKIQNKQIPVRSIIDVANCLENYKDEYIRRFLVDENKNKNLPFKDKVFEYESGKAEIRYTIDFFDGKSITETDYNWFIGNTNNPRAIKAITIDLTIRFYNSLYRNNDTQHNRINIYLTFKDYSENLKYSDAKISVETVNQEKEAHNIYSEVMNILENNEDRYNNTLKYRKIRIQSFTISIGIILSYIIFFILKIKSNSLSPVIAEYLNNKYILIFGQWLIAILLGNIFAHWYILSIYKPLLPNTKYAGYNSSTYKSEYKDDIDNFLEYSEIHIGNYWDAEERRNKIEKIFKITSKIILIQFIISILLFFILK